LPGKSFISLGSATPVDDCYKTIGNPGGG